jgi:hypothetical protein
MEGPAFGILLGKFHFHVLVLAIQLVDCRPHAIKYEDIMEHWLTSS